MRILIFIFFTSFCIISCRNPSGNYEKTNNGIIIHFPAAGNNETRQIKLEVFGERTIHVIASPEKTGAEFRSLMVSGKPDNAVNFKIEESNGSLFLETDSLIAEVSLASGRIGFSNKYGYRYLSEPDAGSKQFIPYDMEDEKTWHVRQVFDSPEDEAFYGLGQHQNGQMNYKGEDVDLTQYNSVIAVPFLLSSRNYGILWDNYSITRFGDPRVYHALSGLKLYDKNGQPGGLTASYYLNDKPDHIVRTETIKTIDFKFLEDMKRLPKDLPLKNVTVQYEGFIETDSAGMNKFLLTFAGYVKVRIDGSQVFSGWREAWNPKFTRFKVRMNPGEKHPVGIEWKPDGNESYLSLEWLPPFPDEQQQRLSLYSDVGNKIDYFFIAGSCPDEIISGYRNLTGIAPVMPRWAMGFWQSRERYQNEEQLISVLGEYRKRRIPIDNIVLDWQYWEPNQWGSHEFDASRFPDPAGMIRKIHDVYHTRIMISVWPKFYVSTGHFRELNEIDGLYVLNVANNQRDWLGYVSTFYDAFNPQARSLFWNQIEDHLFDLHIDGWWLDATEPDILSNSSIRHRIGLMKPNKLGNPERYFNAYPLVNAGGVFEGQRKSDLDRRVFILTRSGYAGIQRYAAATWSGDIAATWDELQLQIPAGLNLSISGIPYWTTDIGGFFVEDRFENPGKKDLDEWRELVARWYQFGAFCPLFRSHGQYPYREIFNVAPSGHPAYETMVAYDKLRYSLMPYIYSLAGRTWYDDYTIMRPLIMDFQNDPNVMDLGNQYMFGPALLVTPVTGYKAEKWKIYLPAGDSWYDAYTGRHFDGGQYIEQEVSLERIPLFVRSGSIIPLGPEIMYSDEKPADPVTLIVYPGSDGKFDLYEDENINNKYEKGAYAIIPVEYDNLTHTLTLEERTGAFPGMLNERIFHIKVMDRDHKGGILDTGKPDRSVRYKGEKITIKITDE